MKLTNSRGSKQPIQYSLNHPFQNQPLAYGNLYPNETVEHVCRIPDEDLYIDLTVGLDASGCGRKIGDTDISEIRQALNKIWNISKSSKIRDKIENIENVLERVI
jgi:hypothetical protein